LCDQETNGTNQDELSPDENPFLKSVEQQTLEPAFNPFDVIEDSQQNELIKLRVENEELKSELKELLTQKSMNEKEKQQEIDILIKEVEHQKAKINELQVSFYF